MSVDGISLEKADWVEELQRKVFEECAAQNEQTISSGESSALTSDSTTWDVPIPVIVNNINQSFAKVPHFRKIQRTDFLEELRKSLQKVSRNDQVNWFEFRDSSERWFLNLVNLLREDGNNNIRLNHSDGPSEDSEKDAHSAEEHSSSNANDDDFHTYSINQITVASCYSLSSSDMGFGSATESMIESSEEIDHGHDVTGIDLEVRIRRHNEETASLREDLVQAEEKIAALERDLKLTGTALERMTNKNINLKKENEDQRGLLSEVIQREESCKLDLRRLEKAYSVLQKKVEELEKQKENIASLKARIDKVTKENSLNKKKIYDYKRMYDEKVDECEYLHGEIKSLENNLCKMEKDHEKNIEHHQEKIEELECLNAELQSKMNGSDSSSRLSMTPPLSQHARVHSTPYLNKVKHQDSLYNELKVAGYNIDENKMQELKHELSMYKEEIAILAGEVEEAWQEIAVSRNEIYVPNVQLIETDSIETLKQKIGPLLDWIKAATKSQLPTIMVEDTSREKPDILSETKNTSGPGNSQVFASDKQESDLIGSVTSSMTTITESEIYGKSDRSTSILSESVASHESHEASRSNEQEIIVPIVEALNRIIKIKGTEDEEESDPKKKSPINTKPTSIFTTSTAKKNRDWMNIVAEASKSYTRKVHEHSSYNSSFFGMGDGPHLNLMKTRSDNNISGPRVDSTSGRSPISEKDYKFRSGETYVKLDFKNVTIRQPEQTYLIDSVVSSTEDNNSFGFGKTKIEEMKSECTFLSSPLAITKLSPRRKLSVYHRSFEIDSLQTPDSLQNSNEKKRSVSTPDVQESDFSELRNKTVQPLDSSVTNSQLLTSYRSMNNSDSSTSLSPTKDDLLLKENADESFLQKNKKETPRFSKPITLAPTKFKIPDSTVDQTIEVNQAINKAETIDQQICLEKGVSFTNNEAQQSRILSSSSNLRKSGLDNVKKNLSAGALDNSADCSKLSNETSNISLTDISTDDPPTNCLDLSDNVFPPGSEKNDQTFTKGVSMSSPKNPSLETASVATAAVVAERKSESEQPASVERAMSSGEDSSTESECENARTSPKGKEESEPAEKQTSSPKYSVVDIDSDGKPVLERRRSNSCQEDRITKDVVMNEDDKIEINQNLNGEKKENGCQNDTANSPHEDILNEDGSVKVFPSWTDEKLKEFGISSYTDLDSEINENLTEEELKKKFVAFSVGLSADRMTLSKRMTSARRNRDQDEKNFTNEVIRMQQNIKELAPLCVDSESVERVERAKLQLEMVVRCAHRISCTAETLGAVYQERRVSRAVLLADRYLQTLRTKCEKLAAELSETKRILAENNIVLEEHLSEMGDDVPRVRYRAVPSNNRTMMARRRASIATISRPLLGSNQDISKEIPRQRNSVSGRVSGLRRPSLCYESQKWEIEKLDRTDSSNSVGELRDIFEQAESRRHSREENNNLIRTSVSNLSTITSEHIEEPEIWSNPRDDIDPELEDDNDVNSYELLQQHRQPIMCWLMSRYSTWKPMILGIFIAFLLGFFINRVVSSNRDGPPIAWWSIEELISQYIQIESQNSAARPI